MVGCVGLLRSLFRRDGIQSRPPPQDPKSSQEDGPPSGETLGVVHSPSQSQCLLRKQGCSRSWEIRCRSGPSLVCVPPPPPSREDLACTLCAVRPSPVLVLVLSTSPMGIRTTPEGPAAHGHLYTCTPQPHQMGQVLGPHALPDHRRRLLGLQPMESAETRHEPQPQHCHQKTSCRAASGGGERGAGQRQAYGLGRGRSVQAALPTAPRPSKCLLGISGVSTNHTELLPC